MNQDERELKRKEYNENDIWQRMEEKGDPYLADRDEIIEYIDLFSEPQAEYGHFIDLSLFVEKHTEAYLYYHLLESVFEIDDNASKEKKLKQKDILCQLLPFIWQSFHKNIIDIDIVRKAHEIISFSDGVFFPNSWMVPYYFFKYENWDLDPEDFYIERDFLDKLSFDERSYFASYFSFSYNSFCDFIKTAPFKNKLEYLKFKLSQLSYFCNESGNFNLSLVNETLDELRSLGEETQDARKISIDLLEKDTRKIILIRDICTKLLYQMNEIEDKYKEYYQQNNIILLDCSNLAQANAAIFRNHLDIGEIKTAKVIERSEELIPLIPVGSLLCRANPEDEAFMRCAGFTAYQVLR